MYRSLLLHPAFAVRRLDRYPDLTESFAVQRILEYPTVQKGSAPGLEAFLFENQELFAEFAEALDSVAAWRKATLPLAKRHPGRVVLHRLAFNVMALRTYFAIAAQARGCRRLVEKTPHNLRFADYITTAFPHAKLLCMLRHPVDTLASYWKRSKVDPEAGWARISVDTFLTRYARSVTLALEEERRRPESFLIVRYERFTEAPEEVFAEICAFVGEPFVSEAVTTDPGGFGVWRPDEHLFGPIVDRSRAWEGDVPPDVAAAVENGLRDTMRLLDFVRYT